MIGTCSSSITYSNPLFLFRGYSYENKKTTLVKHKIELCTDFYKNDNFQFLNQYTSYKFDTIDAKIRQLSSCKDDIMPATRGAQFFTKCLISKTPSREYKLFRTFNGEIQISYYKDKSEPLEIYVAYRNFAVLFPDDTEATFCKTKDTLAAINKYYEA